MSGYETHLFSTDSTSLMAATVFLVGRDDECGLRLDDPTVSRRHARITPGSTSVIVEDLGSSNGTWVNGAPIDAPVEAQIGAPVRFGQAVQFVCPSMDGNCATLSASPGFAAPSMQPASPADAQAKPRTPGSISTARFAPPAGT